MDRRIKSEFIRQDYPKINFESPAFLKYCLPTVWKNSLEIDSDNSASESTINGEFVFDGKKETHSIRRGNRRLSLGERNRKKIPNVHPGEILNEEFLLSMKITAHRLAKETKLNSTRISEIIRGKRGITADTALWFSKFFGNSVEFWMGIQDGFEIREERRKIGPELEGIRHYKELIKA